MTTPELLTHLKEWAGPDPVKIRVRDAVANLLVAVSAGDYKGVDEEGKALPWLMEVIVISPRDRALNRSAGQRRALLEAKLRQVRSALADRWWGD